MIVDISASIRREFVKLYFQGQVLNSSLTEICNKIGESLQIDILEEKNYKSIVKEMIEEMVFDVI